MFVLLALMFGSLHSLPVLNFAFVAFSCMCSSELTLSVGVSSSVYSFPLSCLFFQLCLVILLSSYSYLLSMFLPVCSCLFSPSPRCSLFCFLSRCIRFLPSFILCASFGKRVGCRERTLVWG